MGCRSRSWRAAAFAAVTVVLAGGFAATGGAQVRPTKFDYRLETLDNGLRVILAEDRSTPIVHLQLWYKVGSRDEPPGRTGFAHLFEHLMFQGSQNLQRGDHLALITRIGGEGNAYTTDDSTVYHATVPAEYLPLVLWMEADRMATLRINQEGLDAEREVVKEERRLRYENEPFGLLNEILYEHAFTTHPYRHTTIGSMEDIEAARIEDVREFFDTYYVPENATLALVGDFDTDYAFQLVQHFFGRVPKAERPVPRDLPREPAPAGPRNVTVEADNWPLPAVIVAHPVTYDGHPDAYPLHILSKILSDGQSARIYRRLVYEQQVAVTAFGQSVLIEDPNLFYAVAIVPPGRSTDEAAAALIAELDRAKTDPPTDAELRRAKNQFARDYVIGRITIEQKAMHLAHAVVAHDDVTTADAEFDIFMNVSGDDVQRVAQTYLRDENRLVLTILPRGGGGGGQ